MPLYTADFQPLYTGLRLFYKKRKTSLYQNHPSNIQINTTTMAPKITPHCFFIPLLVVALFQCPLKAQSFQQMGVNITNNNTQQQFGWDVSVQDNRVAIVGFNSQANSRQNETVQVYEWDGSAWNPLGAAITAEVAGDRVCAVSVDGDRVAIGAYWNSGNGIQSGHTRIYEWDGTQWNQLGQDIDGVAARDESGYQVILKGDDVAISAPHHQGAAGRLSGHVRVFTWNGTNWVQKGGEIEGAQAYGYSGIGMDFNGKRLAIGAHYNSTNGQHSGQVRIYEWDGQAWIKLGQDLNGEAAHDVFGADVSLSGNRVAIGSSVNSGAVQEAGHVRVYEWNGQTWVQLGADIDGLVSRARFGSSVALEGDWLAVGAIWSRLGSNSSRGRVYFFHWDGTQWQPALRVLNAPSGTLNFGWSLSMTPDRLAIGGFGTVQVYQWCPRNVVPVTVNGTTLRADATANTYQWYYCANGRYGPINGATAQQYTAQANSGYAVVAQQDGCADTSACYAITSIDVRQLPNAPTLRLYPNPTTQQMTLDLGQAYRRVGLRLKSTTGQIIRQQVYEQIQWVDWSVEALPSALYWLEVQLEDQPPIHLKLRKQ